MGLEKILYILCVALATVLVLMTVSVLLSRLFIANAKRRLLGSIGKDVLPAFMKARASSLPASVQRYLGYALQEGQTNIRYGVLRQSALFRHRPSSPWMDVHATEIISGMEPGFIWDAKLTHRWFWWRTAKLGYYVSHGHGHIKLYGAFPLQEFEGDETDASMLFRFLSDLVWVPTGLLPTKTLRWTAVDDNTANATIRNGEQTVSATFHISNNGQIEKITTLNKFRDYKSGFEQQSFTMHCGDWQEHDGVMIPCEVRFVWNTPSGDFEYGVFKIDSVAYYY